MVSLTLAQKIAIWLLPVLFAITLHEVAHGWMAKRLGDPTAMMLGRLSLNPIRHIDPVGTILVPAIMLMTTSVVFGWARPVPVTWENLKKPKRDMALVAFAGPGANLTMALFWTLMIWVAGQVHSLSPSAALFLAYSGVAGVFINVVMFILNLLPIPPLDGGRILSGLLPGPWAWRLSRIEPYGLVILVVLLLSGALGNLLMPVVSFTALFVAGLSGLQPLYFAEILRIII